MFDLCHEEGARKIDIDQTSEHGRVVCLGRDVAVGNSSGIDEDVWSPSALNLSGAICQLEVEGPGPRKGRRLAAAWWMCTVQVVEAYRPCPRSWESVALDRGRQALGQAVSVLLIVRRIWIEGQCGGQEVIG